MSPKGSVLKAWSPSCAGRWWNILEGPSGRKVSHWGCALERGMRPWPLPPTCRGGDGQDCRSVGQLKVGDLSGRRCLSPRSRLVHTDYSWPYAMWLVLYPDQSISWQAEFLKYKYIMTSQQFVVGYPC